jgi:hypothetical protein
MNGRDLCGEEVGHDDVESPDWRTKCLSVMGMPSRFSERRKCAYTYIYIYTKTKIRLAYVLLTEVPI